MENGFLAIDDLVTIRQGEVVIQPESGKPETTDVELIKIQGRGGEWCCRFLQPDKTCSMYAHRPLSCRLLQCWDTEKVLEITGKGLLNRVALMDRQDPLLPLIRLYDQQFVLPDMIEIMVQLRKHDQRIGTLMQLRELAAKDLLFRSLAVERYELPVSRELFYFGRPVFQLLAPLGVTVIETPDGIDLQYEDN